MITAGPNAELRERVAAYLAEHPKTSNTFVATALGTQPARVRAARIANEQGVPTLGKPLAAIAARRRAVQVKLIAAFDLLNAGETSACELVDKLGLNHEWARKLMQETERIGWTTSRLVTRAELGLLGRGSARRYYKLAVQPATIGEVAA